MRTREQEIRNIGGTKGNYQLAVFLKDVFGFAEHQENATQGLRHNFQLKSHGGSNVYGHRSRTGADDAVIQTDFESRD